MCLLLLVASLFLAPRTQAQNGDSGGDTQNGSPFQKTFDCFGPDYVPIKGNSKAARKGAGGASASSGINTTYGGAFTPHGDLKVLVIFVGFTEDLTRRPLAWDYNIASWPQVGPIGSGFGPGETLPKNYPDVCYTNPSQFNLTSTDQSLSNFFYQMSRTSPNPFKVTFGTLPRRVNVVGNRGNYLNAYTNDALAQAVAQNPGFPWSDYDQHANSPNFTTDNSTTGPDGQLDYVVFCFRPGQYSNVGGGVGISGFSPYVIPGAGESVTTGHCQSGFDIDPGLFLHETAHNLYNAPHTIGANGTVGNHYYGTFGWGMMQSIPTSYSANAWERWYLGWTELKTGPAQDDSDIQDATSFGTTGGKYVLRDYVTTGDVIRIKIPNTDQYLWLENRAKQGPCDVRRGWDVAGDGNRLLPAPTGLLAMVEDMADRSTVLNPIPYPISSSKVGGLRAVSAEGNFDYLTPDPLYAFNNHLWGNTSYNYVGPNGEVPQPNATGGHSEITGIRGDRDGDAVINVDQASGNGDMVLGNEKTFLYNVRDRFTDGLLGPHIGTQQVGFRYALDSNPMIIPHQGFDMNTEELTTIPLNGLSVEIIAVDPVTGDLVLLVRFDETAISQDTRWTGSLKTYPVVGSNYGTEIMVKNGKTLTLDRSATPMRRTPGPGGDFVNSTELRISTGTNLTVAYNGTLRLTGNGTTLYIEDGGSMDLASGSHLVVEPNTLISVQYFSDIYGLTGAPLQGGTIYERSTGNVQNRHAAPTAFPNPATSSITVGWANAAATPADAAAYRYEVQDLQGHTLRRGQCSSQPVALAGVAAGLYLLVTTAPDGTRQTQRVEVR